MFFMSSHPLPKQKCIYVFANTNVDDVEYIYILFVLSCTTLVMTNKIPLMLVNHK
jgi:hypothetical protein